ncbi:vesicle-associated membrane protein 8-like [Rhinatrema bivittatum]|uniref:vesicle-associated membrane protein 8-like n=1 Tax=Rhinatrema bivittatum TaxID=194408 RepID=UPI00112CFC5F|nr:vesicle-associated membrane protein 8-like [Rhinatrema bivittatum]
METNNLPQGSGAVYTLQGQVDNVKNIMTQNINRVLEREVKLDELVIRTDDLQASAHAFQKTSAKIARKTWWKNRKMTVIIVLVVLMVVIIIILLATNVIPT